MEFQVRPTRREQPVSMPWVDQFRAATGGPPKHVYVHDGKITAL
jgi:hypothetical protein